MATYTELFDLRHNSDLMNRISVANIVAAEVIRKETTSVPNHANRLIWAKAVFENPTIEAKRMLWAVLAANKDNTVAQITGASDVEIQTAVDTAIDIFATGV